MLQKIITVFFIGIFISTNLFANPPIVDTMKNTQPKPELPDALFPKLETKTLAGIPVVFPDDSKGKYTVLCFAFVQNAQSLVDTWTFPILEMYPDNEIHYYEIPMLAAGYKYFRGFIDGGMKRGVPEHLHEHVATYYGPLDEYKTLLKMPNDRTVYLFLLDPTGKIIHKTEGAASPEKLKTLFSAIVF
jgi:hypothetical protein